MFFGFCVFLWVDFTLCMHVIVSVCVCAVPGIKPNMPPIPELHPSSRFYFYIKLAYK